eukprot:4066282-Prymnesium_polylepis.1
MAASSERVGRVESGSDARAPLSATIVWSSKPMRYNTSSRSALMVSLGLPLSAAVDHRAAPHPATPRRRAPPSTAP